MAKSSRFKFEYSKNASSLHKSVGDLLRDSIFKNYKIYQEYPVNKINPKFPSGREKFDWYIADLNVIIEVHGQQHYEPVCFGGITEAEAELNFRRQKVRDAMKQGAVESIGATYIIIKYDEELNEKELVQRILDARPDLDEKVTCEIPDPLDELIEETEFQEPKQKEKHTKRIEKKKLASEWRDQLRKKIKGSKKYKENQEKAKKKRHENYLKAKEKYVEKRARKKV